MVQTPVEGVEQTVATTPGTTYDLSFWVGNVSNPSGIFGTTSTVDVRLGGIDGTLLGAFTNDSTATGALSWEQFTTSFLATGPSTTLDFINADPGNDNSNGLDNINLVAGTSGVPELVTLPLLGVAIIGLALIHRRARAARKTA
jgi:hypothetical protein